MSNDDPLAPPGSPDTAERSASSFGSGLGKAMKLRRIARDLGRKELAAEAELSYSYLSEIENGGKSPSSEVLHRIAGALGWSASELVLAAEDVASADDAGRAASFPTPLATRSYQPSDADLRGYRVSVEDAPSVREILTLVSSLSSEDRKVLGDVAERLSKRSWNEAALDDPSFERARRRIAELEAAALDDLPPERAKRRA